MDFKNILAFLFSIILSVECFCLSKSMDNRVVGGVIAENHAHPHQVSLQNNGTSTGHFCGGSLIHERYVLTAAHCTATKDATRIFVLAGTNSLSDAKVGSDGPGVSIGVEQIFVHPDYNTATMLHDISILKLTEPVQLGETIQLIKLPEENHVDPAEVTLTGWGYTSSSSWLIPDCLQEITLPTIATEKCDPLMINSSWPVKECHVCTLHEDLHHGACNGDSGGPLSKDGVLIGLVSWGYPCAVGKPDAYTRVHCYVDWIRETIDKGL